MIFRARKLTAIGVIAAVFFLVNALMIATWLADVGLIGVAGSLRTAYIAGTAIVVIAALLILLPRPSRHGPEPQISFRRCPVCDGALRPGGKYCPACGSRV